MGSDDQNANDDEFARFARQHPEHVRRVLADGDAARAPTEGPGARLHALVLGLIGRYGEVELSPWNSRLSSDALLVGA